MSDEHAIRTESLRKVYRSGRSDVLVLDSVSLQVAVGEKLAVIGESGSGKSTLLHLLGALENPSSGSVWYGSQDLGLLKEEALAQFRNTQIGFVWQIPSLLLEFTALENVMMPLLIRGSAPEKAAVEARVFLEQVGLAARAFHRAGELSGGEQQRVVIARAFVGKPRVILADEPTGSLDFATGESVIDLLTDLHQRHGLTSIFVTHNLSFAKRCDRVLELKKGALHPPSPAGQEFSDVIRDATRLDGGTYV